MNIQGQFLLGLTDLISLQSKGISSVFSSTFQKHIYCEVVTAVKLVNTSILSHPFLGGGGDGDNI